MNNDDTFPHGEGTTNQATSTIQADDEITPFECVQCGKKFSRRAGLNMHKLRVHSNTKMKSGYKWKQKREQRIKKLKREQKRAMTDRYKDMGLNSRGKPFKSKKWSAERRAKFERTWKLKRHADPNHQQPPAVTDTTGEAAHAILVAASVLRAVATGLKITTKP